MEEFHAVAYLREIVIILAAASIFVPLLNKFHIRPVLGYLFSGFLVGPYGLGAFDQPVLSYFTIKNPEEVTQLAEFGVVFLMFMIGLELSPKKLWSMKKMVFGLGALQVVLSAAVISPIAFFFGNSLTASIVLGFCFALSSTAIVMQILMERRKLGTPLGRACFSILLFQDLAVVPLLIFLGVIDKGGEIGPALALALGKAIGVIIALLLAGYYLLRPLFRIAGASSDPEPFMALTLLVIIVTATLTGMTGLSMALGAFLAGLLLAETEYSHAIEVYIEPFKGLLLGLFFMTVGMRLDPSLVINNLGWVAASVIGLIFLKTAVISPLAHAFGLSWGRALETGLVLGQAGEFAFVILGSAMASKLLSHETGQFMLIVTTLTMICTPGISFVARYIRLYFEKKSSNVLIPVAEDIPDIQDHVIIAGTGRVGRTMMRILEAENIPFIAIDNNTAIVEEKRKNGKEVFYGDASRYDLLKLFHPERAAALILTMEDARTATHAIYVMQQNWPNTPIFARARDMRVARILHKAGAHTVIAETVETSLQMANHLLQGIGVDDETIARRLDAEREKSILGIKEA